MDALVTSESGDVCVTAGADIKKKVTANGDAELIAGGDVSGGAVATQGFLEVSAKGSISGDYSARDDLELHAGKDISVNAVGDSIVNVFASGSIRGGSLRSTGAEVNVQASGSISASVNAAGYASVEAVGDISGGNSIKAGKDVSVIAGGNIDGVIEGEWVADVRSSGGEVTATVSTRKTSGWLTDPSSPGKQRLDAIDERIASLNDSLRHFFDPATVSDLQAELARLNGEREVLTIPPQKLDYQRIPAARIRKMIEDGIAKEYDGPPVGSSPLQEYTSGYVCISDVVGTSGYALVLQPIRIGKKAITVANGLDGSFIGRGEFKTVLVDSEESLVGSSDLIEKVEYYRVVSRLDVSYVENSSDFVSKQLSPSMMRMKIEGVANSDFLQSIEKYKEYVEFAAHLLPVVGAVDDFVKGNYKDAAISLAGDAAMLIGLGLAAKGTKCVVAGNRVFKLARATAIGLEGGIAAVQSVRGFNALNSPDPNERAKAWGYFGDATLRLFGVSAQAISWLKSNPKCFVAGTPVHTETGIRPIESISKGDRVWSFDPSLKFWVLAEVTTTFRRVSSELVTLALGNGDSLAGTPEHPFWAIEGNELQSRPRPTHGFDEDWSGVTGRWVNLGDLRAGDVVLTRDGGTSRVLSANVRQEIKPVFNFEVAGLQNYAIGEFGVLTHNYPDLVVPPNAKNVPAKVEAPLENVVVTKKATPTASTTKSKSVSDAKVVKEKVAPNGGTTTPSVKSRHPRGENVHFRTGKPQRRLSPVSDAQVREAIEPKFEAYNKAKAAKKEAKLKKLDETDPTAFAALENAQKQAAEEFGKAGAEAFMAKMCPNAKKVHVGRKGNGDFDFIYHDEKTGSFFVVEAKGGNSSRTTVNVNKGILDSKGNPLVPKNAQQGTKDYLIAQIEFMQALPDSDPRKAIGVALFDANKKGKIAYMEVAAKQSESKRGCYLMASQWLGEPAW